LKIAIFTYFYSDCRS